MFNLFGRTNTCNVKRISAKEARAMIENHAALLIDVRTPEEYRQRRISGSKNLPLDAIGANAQRYLPDKRQPLILCCLSGGRSAQACSLLSRMGYETIYDLGGINTWPYETIRG